MQGKTHYANGQPMFEQDGERLTWFFKTGRKKAEGRSIAGVMQANGVSGAYSDETRHRFQSNVGHCFQRKLCHLFRSKPSQPFHSKVGH
jgi:hypothetical protein